MPNDRPATDAYDEEPLELDLSEEQAGRFRRQSIDVPPQYQPPKRASEDVSQRDLDEARRLAGYGTAHGFFDAVFYALSVGPKRRALLKLLRAAEKKRDLAKAEAKAAHLAYGKRLHERATEADLSMVQTQLAIVDHAVLFQQQRSHERRSKNERAIAQTRVDDAYDKLAGAALELRLNVDPEGLSRYSAAVKEFLQLKREAQLREMGIDTYDKPAVSRGWMLILLVVAFIVGSGVYMWIRTRS